MVRFISLLEKNIRNVHVHSIRIGDGSIAVSVKSTFSPQLKSFYHYSDRLLSVRSFFPSISCHLRPKVDESALYQIFGGLRRDILRSVEYDPVRFDYSNITVII